MATFFNGQLTKEQATFYGELAAAKPFSGTPYLDMFTITQAPSTKKIIQFDMYVGKTKMASLKKKFGNGIKLLNNGFARITIEAGAVEASINIEAEELQEMKSGEREVLINGETVKTANALMQSKMRILKDSLVQRFNLMSAELIKNGVVNFDDGDTFDWNIPSSVAKTWNSTTSIINILSDALRDYRKRNNNRLPNRILVGPKLAQALLIDDEFKGSRDAYNRNIGNFDATSKGVIIGAFLNQIFEEADLALDKNGDDIVGEWDIKFIDTTLLRRLYAGIPIINAAGQPDIIAADWFADLEVESKKGATAELFGKSGFVPAVVDPESIVTYTITKS